MDRTRRRARRWVWALLAVTLPARPLLPQDAAGESIVERIEVELVNVEVWVTGRDDRFVSGLTVDDFVVLHDGEPVPIEYFAELRSGEVTSLDAQSVTSRGGTETRSGSGETLERAHMIVYFDDLNLQPGNRKILVDHLKGFLDEQRITAERVLVLRQDRGLYIEAPFGSTEGELVEALTRISQSGAVGASLATDADQAIQEIRSIWNSSRDTAGSAATGLAGVPQGAAITTIPDAGGGTSPSGVVGGGGGGGVGEFGPSPCEIFIGRVEPLINNFYRQRAAQIGITLTRLSETVTFLAGLEGVKALVYLSDRLETAPAAGLASYAAGFCPTEHQNLLLGTQTEDLGRSLSDLARHASANRVTIYGVQGRGLRSVGSGSPEVSGEAFRGPGGFEGAARTNQQGGFLLLARESGGRAILNTNDFGAAFESVRRDMGSFYSIAYRPPSSGTSKFHTIDVKVEGTGLNARHRRGYREKTDDERLAERVLGALNLGVTSNPHSLRLGAGSARPGDDGGFVVPVRVRVPVEAVTWVPGEGGSKGEIRLKMSARDVSRGRVIDENRLFRLTLPPGKTGDFVDLGVDLGLTEGVHVVAVGLRDNTSGLISFVSTTIEIADPT